MPNPILELHCRRVLRQLVADDSNPRQSATIGVTACRRRAGVSTVARQLALESQQLGEPVLLVDANRRRESQPADRECKKPLGELLETLGAGEPSAEELTRSTFEGSDAFPDLLATSSAYFPWIWIDLPPLGSREFDASLLCGLEGVILVVEDERTTRREVSSAQRTIQAAGPVPLGLVINKRKQRLPRWLARLLD